MWSKPTCLSAAPPPGAARTRSRALPPACGAEPLACFTGLFTGHASPCSLPVSPRSGVAHCARGILAREGARGFLRGWSANYFRLGPQTCITFVVYERLRLWAGLGHV